MRSGWAGRRVDGKTHMFRIICFIGFSNSVKYNCFYMTFATARCRQIYLFGRIHVLLGLAPRHSETLACKSCAQASRIVRVASLPCRRRRSPIIFRWENTGVFEHFLFLHFCKFVCCCFHIVILMRRWCCFGGGVFNISKTLPIWWPM